MATASHYSAYNCGINISPDTLQEYLLCPWHCPGQLSRELEGSPGTSAKVRMALLVAGSVGGPWGGLGGPGGGDRQGLLYLLLPAVQASGRPGSEGFPRSQSLPMCHPSQAHSE